MSVVTDAAMLAVSVSGLGALFQFACSGFPAPVFAVYPVAVPLAEFHWRFTAGQFPEHSDTACFVTGRVRPAEREITHRPCKTTPCKTIPGKTTPCRVAASATSLQAISSCWWSQFRGQACGASGSASRQHQKRCGALNIARQIPHRSAPAVPTVPGS